MNILREKDLNAACKGGNLETVQEILGTTRGHYPKALEIATEFGRHLIVEFLLSLGTSPTVTALQSACEHGEVRILKMLIKFGGKHVLSTDVIDKAAFSGGDPEIFEILIENNCPVSSTALDNAIEGSNMNLLKVILETKFQGMRVKPSVKTFSYALRYNNVEAIHLLTKNSNDLVEDWTAGILSARKHKKIESSLLAVKQFLSADEYQKVQDRIKFNLPNVELFLNEEEDAA